jgi:hypothetical protein
MALAKLSDRGCRNDERHDGWIVGDVEARGDDDGRIVRDVEARGDIDAWIVGDVETRVAVDAGSSGMSKPGSASIGNRRGCRNEGRRRSGIVGDARTTSGEERRPSVRLRSSERRSNRERACRRVGRFVRVATHGAGWAREKTAPDRNR